MTNPYRESYRDAALMLAEEHVATAEAAMQMPLVRFLEWCVRVEARWERKAAARRG